MQYVTMDEFLMGRTTLDQLSDELVANANTTVPRANELLDAFGEYRKCNSGYRTPEDQARINPKALHSKHLSCQAIDLSDPDGKLDDFCLKNQDVLAKIGLWLEDPKSTPGWTHVQVVAPGSGHRVFIP